MNRNSDTHPVLRGRETVLMLDQPATRRYHLTQDCPHLKGASTPIREVSIDDRDASLVGSTFESEHMTITISESSSPSSELEDDVDE